MSASSSARGSAHVASGTRQALSPNGSSVTAVTSLHLHQRRVHRARRARRARWRRRPACRRAADGVESARGRELERTARRDRGIRDERSGSPRGTSVPSGRVARSANPSRAIARAPRARRDREELARRRTHDGDPGPRARRRAIQQRASRPLRPPAPRGRARRAPSRTRASLPPRRDASRKPGALLGDARPQVARRHLHRLPPEPCAVRIRRVRSHARAVGDAHRHRPAHRRLVTRVASARDVREVRARVERLRLVRQLTRDRCRGARGPPPAAMSRTMLSMSPRLKGFSTRRLSTDARNSAARAVKAPPVMKTMRSSSPGRSVRTRS